MSSYRLQLYSVLYSSASESEGDSTSNFGQGSQGPVKWCPSNFERWVGPRQILSRRWAPWGGRLSLCESVKFRAVGPSKADERATTTMSMLQRSTAAAPCAAQQARTAALLRRRTDHSHHAPCRTSPVLLVHGKLHWQHHALPGAGPHRPHRAPFVIF